MLLRLLLLPSLRAWSRGAVPADPRTGIPLISMGGINATHLPGKSAGGTTNYSLWIELGGRSFDTAW